MQLSKNEFRCGYVALIGRPNVGKSTLINVFLGQKVAAVSPKPQTTRQRQLGILTTRDDQLVFVDTPGIHIPHHKLGKAMNAVAREVLMEADVILWIVDVSRSPHEEDHLIASQLIEINPLPPVVLALNKVDALADDLHSKREEQYHQLLTCAQQIFISALTGYQLEQLLACLKALLPVGEPFYPPDQITDFYEREIAADLIREAAMLFLHEEVPHAVAVRIDQYKERAEKGAYIIATLFVEKDSQKGIVIGRGGAMLKKIGTTARMSIEKMSGRKVFLELRVKVNKNWRNNESVLRHMGYPKIEEG
ncbi:MAG TPA: GTPase Era [Anaerolineae bacterium]|nr:GTPase Era [Anaerolineae bacterium]